MIRLFKKALKRNKKSCSCYVCGNTVRPDTMNYGGNLFCSYTCFEQYIQGVPLQDILKAEAMERNKRNG